MNALIRPMNIIEINEMMDQLTDFFNITLSRCDQHIAYVGGICGSPLLKTILDAATAYTSFDKILIVDGCVDYVYMQKKDKHVVNHVPYKNLFQDVFVCEEPYDPFNLKLVSTEKAIEKKVDHQFLQAYDVMVIYNAHLMEHEFVQALATSFCGKVVIAVDPFDVGCELWISVPTIIRSFNKVAPMIAMARNVWNVETDMINKQAKGGVFNGKIRRSSIGSLQDRVYVTCDKLLIDQVRAKQNMKQIKRNQKFIITDNRTLVALDDDKFRHHISYGDILVAGTQSEHNARNPYRLYHSDKWMYLNLRRDVPTTSQFAIEGSTAHQMKAVPGNILDVDIAKRHKFGNVIFIQTDGFITDIRTMYMLMKNSVTLTVCKIKN
jgi:uncharacterized ubiquitin-like protein YukD